jgi:tetratricopeptide (TPR) repeat protein
VEVLRLAPGSSTAAAARLEAAHVRIDDLIAWAEVCRARGEHAIGAEATELAAARARRQGDPVREARALALAALHRTRVGQHRRAVVIGQRALSLLERSADRRLVGEVHATIALASVNSRVPRRALHHALEACREAESHRDPHARFWALTRLSMAYGLARDDERAAALGREALALARANNDEEEIFAAHSNQAGTMLRCWGETGIGNRGAASRIDARESLRLAVQARVLAGRLGNPHRWGLALLSVILARLDLGDHDRALAAADAMAERVLDEGLPGLAMQARVAAARALDGMGRADEAIHVLHDLIDNDTAAGAAALAHRTLCHVHWRAGRFVDAQRHLEAFRSARAAEANDNAAGANAAGATAAAANTKHVPARV